MSVSAFKTDFSPDSVWSVRSRFSAFLSKDFVTLDIVFRTEEYRSSALMTMEMEPAVLSPPFLDNSREIMIY